jgi:hypothetical protein
MKVKNVEDVRRLGNFMGAIVLDAESRVAEVNSNMLKILEDYPVGSINFATMHAIMRDILPLASTLETEPTEENGIIKYPTPDTKCLKDPRFLNKISTFSKDEQQQILEAIRISAKFGPKIRMFKDAQEVLLQPSSPKSRDRDYATILQDPSNPSKRIFNPEGYENYLLYIQRYAPRQVQNFHIFIDNNSKSVLSHHYYKMSSDSYTRYLETYADNPRMPQKEAELRARIHDSMGSSIVRGYRPLSQIKLTNKQTFGENLAQLTKENRSYHPVISELGNKLTYSGKYIGQKAAQAVTSKTGKKVIAFALCALIAGSSVSKIHHANEFADAYVDNPVSISENLNNYGALSQKSLEALQSNQDLINEVIKQGIDVDGVTLSKLRNGLDSGIDMVIDDIFHDAIQDYYNDRYQGDDARTVSNVSLFYDNRQKNNPRSGLKVEYKGQYGLDHSEEMYIDFTPLKDLFVESKGGKAASLHGLLDAELTLDNTMYNLMGMITDQNLSKAERQDAYNHFVEYAETIQAGARIAASNTPKVSKHMFYTGVSLEANEANIDGEEMEH